MGSTPRGSLIFASALIASLTDPAAIVAGSLDQGRHRVGRLPDRENLDRVAHEPAIVFFEQRHNRRDDFGQPVVRRRPLEAAEAFFFLVRYPATSTG